MTFNLSVLEFIADKAKSRMAEYGKEFPKNCTDSNDIFDELDSLVEEELSPIAAIYLLGKKKSSKKSDALNKARNWGYYAVDTIAFDPELPSILCDGYKLWQKG